MRGSLGMVLRAWPVYFVVSCQARIQLCSLDVIVRSMYFVSSEGIHFLQYPSRINKQRLLRAVVPLRRVNRAARVPKSHDSDRAVAFICSAVAVHGRLSGEREERERGVSCCFAAGIFSAQPRGRLLRNGNAVNKACLVERAGSIVDVHSWPFFRTHEARVTSTPADSPSKFILCGLPFYGGRIHASPAPGPSVMPMPSHDKEGNSKTPPRKLCSNLAVSINNGCRRCAVSAC